MQPCTCICCELQELTGNEVYFLHRWERCYFVVDHNGFRTEEVPEEDASDLAHSEMPPFQQRWIILPLMLSLQASTVLMSLATTVTSSVHRRSLLCNWAEMNPRHAIVSCQVPMSHAQAAKASPKGPALILCVGMQD